MDDPEETSRAVEREGQECFGRVCQRRWPVLQFLRPRWHDFWITRMPPQLPGHEEALLIDFDCPDAPRPLVASTNRDDLIAGGSIRTKWSNVSGGSVSGMSVPSPRGRRFTRNARTLATRPARDGGSRVGSGISREDAAFAGRYAEPYVVSAQGAAVRRWSAREEGSTRGSPNYRELPELTRPAET